MDDKPIIGRVEFGPFLPPGVRAVGDFAWDMACAHLAPRIAALEAVAKAAERLAVDFGEMFEADGGAASWCRACGATCGDVTPHDEDCPVLALDAALAALREAGGEA